MNRAWEAFMVFLCILEIPIIVLTFFGFFHGNPELGSLYILVILLIGVLIFFTSKRMRCSRLLFYFRMWFKPNAYIILNQTTSLDFTGSDIIYKVQIEYQSLVNYTFGVLERFLGSENANKSSISNITIDDKHAITQVWDENGWVYFTVFPKKPITAGDTDSFSYELKMKHAQPIISSLVHDEKPVKCLRLRTIFPREDYATNVNFKVSFGDSNPEDLYRKPLENRREHIKEINFPRRGYRYIIDWEI